MGNSSSSAANEVILLGCVAYGPTVGPIWEGMRQYMNAAGVPFDFIMFTSYDRQVEALVSGYIDVAWNGPLAHARLKRRTGGKSVSLGMRDCDRDFLTRLVVRKNSGIKTLADLRGKKLAVGCYDSPQANVLPLQAVAAQPDGAALLASIHVLRFDKDVGKHGDTAAGELDVLRALSDGEVDAGFVSEVMWAAAVARGDVNGRGKLALVALDASLVPPFDHCQFDAMPSLSAAKREAFQKAIFAMSMDKPEEAAVMRLEGIRRAWEPPREEGYATMHAALANEPADRPFPPPRDTVASHRFASLEIRADKGVHATQFERACV